MDKWLDTVGKIRQWVIDEHDETTKKPIKLNSKEEKIKDRIYRAWIVIYHDKTYSASQSAIEHSNRERISVRQATRDVEAAIIIFKDPFEANRAALKATYRDVALRNLALAEQMGKHASVTKYLSILIKLDGFDRPEVDKIDLSAQKLPAIVAGQTDKTITQALPENVEAVFERLILKKQKQAQLTQQTITIDPEDE